jgi:hypothetical protein
MYQKTIVLQGNVPADKLEVEVWDGCVIFTSYNEDSKEVGEPVLLDKAQVDELWAQLERYYDTLVENETLDGWYHTDWYDDGN